MKAKKFTKETIATIGVTDRGFPQFGIGDTIAVSQKIKEGDKERIQVFEGDVIAQNRHGISSTFTVRKIAANGVSVKRIFPIHSPLVESINVIRRGDVRRAKLYYLEDRVGKAGRVKEKIVSKKTEVSPTGQL